MEQIVKKSLPNPFSKKLDELLANSWIQVENKHPPNLYDTVMNTKEYKSNFRVLLLDEQENRCCYCMRDMSETEVNLEHIIPNKANKDKYAEYANEPIDQSGFVHKDDFKPSRSEATYPAYPHDIAYQNLIAACETFPHCNCTSNNSRGSKFMPTFTYYKGITKALLVSSSGELRFTSVSNFDEKYLGIKYLNLNTDMLKLFRATWRFACSSYTIEDLKSADERKRMDFLMEAYPLVKSEKDTFELDNEGIWHEFLRYSWFYDYFKNSLTI